MSSSLSPLGCVTLTTRFSSHHHLLRSDRNQISLAIHIAAVMMNRVGEMHKNPKRNNNLFMKSTFIWKEIWEINTIDIKIKLANAKIRIFQFKEKVIFFYCYSGNPFDLEYLIALFITFKETRTNRSQNIY